MEQYVIKTTLETLNNLGISMLEFDNLSQEEKLKIEHDTYSLQEMVDLINSCELEDFNPEYNIFTLIKERILLSG